MSEADILHQRIRSKIMDSQRNTIACYQQLMTRNRKCKLSGRPPGPIKEHVERLWTLEEAIHNNMKKKLDCIVRLERLEKRDVCKRKRIQDLEPLPSYITMDQLVKDCERCGELQRMYREKLRVDLGLWDTNSLTASPHVSSVPSSSINPFEAVNNQKVPDRSGIELTLQQEIHDKPVEGKRAKRRMISLNLTSSQQDVQDSTKQKQNGNSEINIEKSLDTVSDDQLLSRWFLGKQPLATLESTGKKPPEISKSLLAVPNGDDQTFTFEKRSLLWATIESMEAFRVFPQKPHFRPLASMKESAREGHAISKMVDFSGVYEEMRRLQIDHPRAEIEDQLETLSELETYGFDINLIRNRLMELISLKGKREGLESRSKEVKDNIGNHRVELQEADNAIESIDKQVSELMEKHARVLKEKEKKDSEISGLQGEIDEIEGDMRELCCEFDELAASSFV